MRQWAKSHEKLLFVLILLVGIAGAVIGLGRVEFHNEVEQDVLHDVFLGYVDEATYSGSVTVTAAQMPPWCQAQGITGEQTLTFADGAYGRIGIYADLYDLENRYELRTWFSGRLLERQSEYYYRIKGDIRLEPVYAPLAAQIDVADIQVPDYDISTFKGK